MICRKLSQSTRNHRSPVQSSHFREENRKRPRRSKRHWGHLTTTVALDCRDCVRVNGDLVLSIGKISYEVTERKSSRFLRAGASPFLCSKKRIGSYPEKILFILIASTSELREENRHWGHLTTTVALEFHSLFLHPNANAHQVSTCY